MPVCGYVVVPRAGEAEAVTRELSGFEGCQVAPAENAEILLLVTDTESFEEDQALRAEVEAVPGIQALLLTFGEVDPDAPVADPLSRVAGRPAKTPNEAGQGR